MKTKAVPSGWLERDGRRLDCGPYMSGALEARLAISALSVKKQPLFELCERGREGIFHAGRETRRWVEDPRAGIRFLGSTDILAADLQGLPLIAKSQVEKNPRLRIHEGWTLITRTGTIGRMAYCRSDMDGLACSEHVMRVVPNTNKILPGYLFAYLASRFGVPLVAGGTYGSIIQSIEPQHIAELPVPRFGALEQRIHEFVIDAARLRTESSNLLEQAKIDTANAWGIEPLLQLRTQNHPDVKIISSAALHRTARFDAFFYGASAAQSDAILSDISKRHPIRRIGDAEVSRTVFETARFGRVTVQDPAFGVPFLSIADMMRGDPRAESHISRKQALQVNAIVHAGWLILPRVGQLQGAFGTISYVGRHLDGVAVSDNNIRIVPLGEDEGAYLWAALSTNLLYQQIIRRACGTSIPYIDAKRVGDIPVPWPDERQRVRIATIVKDAMEMRSQASRQEGEAVRLVEHAILPGAN